MKTLWLYIKDLFTGKCMKHRNTYKTWRTMRTGDSMFDGYSYLACDLCEIEEIAAQNSYRR